MTKAFLDSMIQDIKAAGMVAKATPWSFEGIGDKKMNVRFIGLTIKNDWLDIFSEKDNLLLKFVYDRNQAYIEAYLANSTPFQKIMTLFVTTGDKWEPLLGQMKHRLKKDKVAYQHHTEQVGNVYSRLKPYLK